MKPLIPPSLWISVAERLPEAVFGEQNKKPIISEDVLVYFEGGDCRFESANYDHETNSWHLVSRGFATADCAPSHWMPLPEPPK